MFQGRSLIESGDSDDLWFWRKSLVLHPCGSPSTTSPPFHKAGVFELDNSLVCQTMAGKAELPRIDSIFTKQRHLAHEKRAPSATVL
jgi:hypothetical protein